MKYNIGDVIEVPNRFYAYGTLVETHPIPGQYVVKDASLRSGWPTYHLLSIDGTVCIYSAAVLESKSRKI